MDMRFLNEREELVLRTIIDEYIDTNEPVGSRNVSKVGPLKMSPATIRNIMSDLVDKGFIAQTHTSSGRVPTDSGYRYYIDKFIGMQHISPDIMEDIQKEMAVEPVNVMNFFRHFSKKLGDMTNSVGFVVAPRLNSISMKHIEFIKLNKDTALAVLVAKSGIVQNVLLPIGSHISGSDLERMGNYLSGKFCNMTMSDIRNALVSELEIARGEIKNLTEKTIEMSDAIFNSPIFDEEFIFEGTKNIIDTPELRGSGKMADILRAFEEKRDICALLDGCMKEDCVQIFIGSEIGLESASELGMVIKPYRRGGNIIGTMGVIGPKRMKYSSVVSIVDYSSRIISKILNDYYEGDK